MTKKLVGKNKFKRKPPNPTGKGGFREHPENRIDGFKLYPENIARGRWSKETSFSYWLNFFKTLPLEEFKRYKTEHPDLCMAGIAAWARISRSIEKLDEFREVANRTEGMPTQRTELAGADGEPIKIQTTVDVGKLSKREQEEFLSIYNKLVNNDNND